jgi:hypothetical protein
MSDDSSPSSGPLGGRSLAAILVILLASPFAFLLGPQGGRTSPPAGTGTGQNTPASASSQPASALSPAYCRERFFRPFEEALNVRKEQKAPDDAVEVSGRLEPGGGVSVRLAPVDTPAASWQDRLAQLQAKIRERSCMSVDTIVATLAGPFAARRRLDHPPAFRPHRRSPRGAQSVFGRQLRGQRTRSAQG